jgi:DNA-binding transcriptional regulator YdaS (Cro superfamily)
MEQLRAFLRSLPDMVARHAFAARCGTSFGYLKTAINARKRFGVELVIAIERASEGVVTRKMLRPDVDWDFLRSAPGIRRARQIKRPRVDPSAADA